MPHVDKSTEEFRSDAISRLDNAVVDVEDEGQRLLAMFKFAREAVQKQMMDGMGYRGEAVSKKDLDALDSLSGMFSRVSASMLALDKTADLRAKKLTKTQYLDIAKKLVLSLPHADRNRWLKDALAQHAVLLKTDPNPKAFKPLTLSAPGASAPEQPGLVVPESTLPPADEVGEQEPDDGA